jgi:hypothetical protein
MWGNKIPSNSVRLFCQCCNTAVFHYQFRVCVILSCSAVQCSAVQKIAFGPLQHNYYWFRVSFGLMIKFLFVPRPLMCLEIGSHFMLMVRMFMYHFETGPSSQMSVSQSKNKAHKWYRNKVYFRVEKIITEIANVSSGTKCVLLYSWRCVSDSFSSACRMLRSD